MPFQSEKQRRYLHANHPEIAKRWEKEYSHGGILDITGDEEITTEEGNDISLVDESETGISTLFRAKDGGTPQLAKKSKDGKRPGYRGDDAYGGGGWGPGAGSPGTTSSGGNVNTGSGDGGADARETYIATQYTSPPAKQSFEDATKGTLSDPEEKYDTPEQHLANIPGDLKGPRVNKYKTRVNANYTQKALELAEKNQQAALKKMGLQKLGKMGVMLAAMVGIYNVPLMDALKALPKTLSIGKSDVKSLLKESLPVMKAKKAHIEALELHKGALLKDVDITNPNEMVNLEETTDFTKTRDQLTELTTIKEDDPDSGPGPISPLPVGGEEETDAYAQTDYGNTMWRDTQALYAQLSDKWAEEKAARDAQYAELTKENPIGTETEIIALRNSGGLANLFRVKNQ